MTLLWLASTSSRSTPLPSTSQNGRAWWCGSRLFHRFRRINLDNLPLLHVCIYIYIYPTITTFSNIFFLFPAEFGIIFQIQGRKTTINSTHLTPPQFLWFSSADPAIKYYLEIGTGARHEHITLTDLSEDRSVIYSYESIAIDTLWWTNIAMENGHL